MRSLALCTVVLLVLVPNIVFAVNWEDGSLDISLTSEAYYQDVWGNKEKSILEEGWQYLDNLIMDLNHSFSEDFNFQGYAHMRASNDPQNQIHDRYVMFVEGYTRFFNDTYEVWGGDFAESYTPYTLSTSLLGAKASYQYSQWGKVYTLFGRNRDQALDQYMQYTSGGRLEFFLKDYLTVGGTFINTEVANDSLDPHPDAVFGDQFNRVYGGDLKLNLWDDKINLEAEYARSVYNDDEQDVTVQDQEDDAVFVKANITPINSLSIGGEFERVEPWFTSILGAASQDLQRAKGEIGYSLGSLLSTILLYEYSFDRLNDHSFLDYRTNYHLASFSSSILPFHKREDSLNSFAINLQLDYDRSYSEDFPRTVDQNNFSVYCDVSQSFPVWNYSLGYNYGRSWNIVDTSSEFFSHSPSASLGINYPWLGLDWSWSFNLGYEYRETFIGNYIDRVYRGDSALSLNYAKTKSNLALNFSIEYNKNDPTSPFAIPDNNSRTYGVLFDQVLKETDAFTASLTLNASLMDYNEDVFDGDYNEAIYFIGLDMKF